MDDRGNSRERADWAAEAIETRSVRIWLRPDGIIQVVVRPGVDQGAAEAQENLAAARRLCPTGPRPILVDLRPTNRPLTREAREQYAGENEAGSARAVALLVSSPVSRVFGNFFISINRPRVPTQMFSVEAEAITWLRGFLA